MRTLSSIALCTSLVLPFAGLALAQGDSSEEVRVTIYPDRNVASRGGDLVIAVILDHNNGWHTNTNNPNLPPGAEDFADTIIRTEINASGSSGLIVRPDLIQWPEPTEHMVELFGPPTPFELFDGRAIAFIPVVVANDAPIGPASLSVTVKFQACNDQICLQPATVNDTIELAIVARAVEDQAADPAIFRDFRSDVLASIDRGPPPSGGGLSTALLLIILGAGVILIAVVIIGARMALSR